MAKADLYISVDVETDGPIPGEYSMLSLGACAAARFDGERMEALDPEADTFYCELRPVTQNFVAQAVAVAEAGGLSRERLLREGEDPAEAMVRFCDWVRLVAGTDRPVFCAYPLSFDWMFSHYYLERFAGSDPFGFSSAVDMKTLYLAKAGCTVSQATKSRMPRQLVRSRFAHTHNALDDAKGQAELLCNLLAWGGGRR